MSTSVVVVQWLIAAPACIVAALVLLNLLVWPRGRAGCDAPATSILIPARNEAHQIAAALHAALAAEPAALEVLVYDDGSTDRTADIVRRSAAVDGRVRLLTGHALPAGWVGKPHACHHLAEAARGDVLLFLDADTFPDRDCLARVAALLHDYRADVVTAATRQRVRTFAERLIVPLLHLSYVAWLPLPLVWRSADARFTVANGQLLAVRRAAYDAAGGWRAVRAEVVDDLAFCRRVKASGGRVVFADGQRMASCRMYRGAAEVWRGFSKNLYEGIGGSLPALATVILLHLLVFVLPYIALAAALLGAHALLVPALIGVGANVVLRGALALRYAQPAEGVLLHPFAVLALLAIALNSFRWSRRGQITWRGRSYAARSARTAS